MIVTKSHSTPILIPCLGHWLALPFGDQTVKELAKHFDVCGIPCLIIIGPDGKTVTKQGRNLINFTKKMHTLSLKRKWSCQRNKWMKRLRAFQDWCTIQGIATSSIWCLKAMEESLLYVVIVMNKGVVGLTSVWNVGTRCPKCVTTADRPFTGQQSIGSALVLMLITWMLHVCALKFKLCGFVCGFRILGLGIFWIIYISNTSSNTDLLSMVAMILGKSRSPPGYYAVRIVYCYPEGAPACCN